MILFVAVAIAPVSFAAAPGGVDANLSLWFRADSGVSTTTDGDTVTTWSDQSLSANNLNASGSPSYQSNVFNFNPIVRFDTTDRYSLSNANAVTSRNSTIFFVGIPGTSATDYGYETWVTDGNGYNPDGLLYKHANRIQYYDGPGGSGGNGGYRVSTISWLQNEKSLTKAELADSAQYTVNVSKNGGNEETLNPGNDYNGDNGYYTFFGNWKDASFKEPFGDIAETAVYQTSSLTDEETRRIESYLALKYGITLEHNNTNDQNPRNFYLDSNGNHVYSIQAYLFRNNIIGIAKDSGSGLDQRISRSTTQGISPAIVTISTDGDFTSANTTHADTLSDGQYVVLGARGTTADPNDLQTTGNSEYTHRIKRDWRLENTGNVGTIHLKFDGFDDEWYLFRTANGTVNNYTNGSMLAQLDANGEVSLTIPNGTVFTLARKSVTITVDDVSVDEDAGTATVTFRADNPLRGGYSFDVATSDGTASAGSDYTAVNQTLTFSGTAGETHTVSIPITDDADSEAVETFTISMSNASNATLVDVSDTATVTIRDNDSGSHTITPNPPAIVGPGTTTFQANGSCGAAFANGTVEFTTDPAGQITPHPTVANLDGNGDYANVSITSVNPITSDFNIVVTCKNQGGDPGVQIVKGPYDLNEAPVIGSNGGGATATIEVVEGNQGVTTVQANDPNVGDTLTYSLSGGVDLAQFSIDASTGELTFVSAPYYDSPTDSDGDNRYIVEVTVTDAGGLTDVQEITVVVKKKRSHRGGSKRSSGGDRDEYRCRDPRATNYALSGKHDPSLCEYEETCRDPRATNYADHGKHNESLCEYGDERKDDQRGGDDGSASDNLLGDGKLCPSSLIIHENMKRGDRDGKYSPWERKVITEVKLLQKHMNRLGFRSGPEDGIFGPITESAVKRMQASLGVRVDGIVGPETRSAINHSCGEEEEELDPSISKCPVFTKYHRRGDRGGEVAKIQKFLRDVVKVYRGKVDGIFGEETFQAVKRFQEKYRDRILKPWGMTRASGRWYQSTKNTANFLSGCRERTVLDNGYILQ